MGRPWDNVLAKRWWARGLHVRQKEPVPRAQRCAARLDKLCMCLRHVLARRQVTREQEGQRKKISHFWQKECLCRCLSPVTCELALQGALAPATRPRSVADRLGSMEPNVRRSGREVSQTQKYEPGVCPRTTGPWQLRCGRAGSTGRHPMHSRHPSRG